MGFLGFSSDSMASYYAEQGFDSWCYGEEEYEPTQEDKRCRYCRKSGFHWEQTAKGWRLFTEKGHLHSCKNGKPLKLKFGEK